MLLLSYSSVSVSGLCVHCTGSTPWRGASIPSSLFLWLLWLWLLLFVYAVVQNWIPTFLASFGGSGQGIAVTGGLSSIPWIAAAVVGPLVGQAANSLIKGGVLGQLAVRRLMQVTCFLGCAASVVPLALVREPSVGLAVACLTGSLALYRWD